MRIVTTDEGNWRRVCAGISQAGNFNYVYRQIGAETSTPIEERQINPLDMPEI
jgi:hypothetical protein